MTLKLFFPARQLIASQVHVLPLNGQDPDTFCMFKYLPVCFAWSKTCRRVKASKKVDMICFIPSSVRIISTKSATSIQKANSLV